MVHFNENPACSRHFRDFFPFPKKNSTQKGAGISCAFLSLLLFAGNQQEKARI